MVQFKAGAEDCVKAGVFEEVTAISAEPFIYMEQVTYTARLC